MDFGVWSVCDYKIFNWYWTNTSGNSRTIKKCTWSKGHDGCYSGQIDGTIQRKWIGCTWYVKEQEPSDTDFFNIQAIHDLLEEDHHKFILEICFQLQLSNALTVQCIRNFHVSTCLTAPNYFGTTYISQYSNQLLWFMWRSWLFLVQ